MDLLATLILARSKLPQADPASPNGQSRWIRTTHLCGGGFFLIAATLSALVSTGTWASNIDKIYHPYVEEDTHEMEFRYIRSMNNALDLTLARYRLGFGKDIWEKGFIEAYVNARKSDAGDLDIFAYEVESLFQFAEQENTGPMLGCSWSWKKKSSGLNGKPKSACWLKRNLASGATP